MSDIRCSREGIKCDGCPIMDKCEHIEITEEIDPFALYQQGRTDERANIKKELFKILDRNELATGMRMVTEKNINKLIK